MAKIRIQNIGPIKDTGMIDLTVVNLFIGRQSSGKSTLLKIICYCRWLDKRVAIGGRVGDKTVAYAYSHYNRFVRELMHFYRFNENFFSSESSVEYTGDVIRIFFKGGINKNAKIELLTSPTRYNSSLCFIPSERNVLSAVKNIEATYRATDMDMLFNFIFEWGEVRERYTPEHRLKLSVAPEIEFYYEKDRGGLIEMRRKDRREIPPFSPFYASSGIQSALPLEAMTHSTVNSIGQNASLSQSDMTQILSRLIRGNATPTELQRAIETEASISRNLLTYQGAQLFIEEPEQNLFPESQAAVTRSIVAAIKRANTVGLPGKSLVAMTTHSPYVLSALNVLMAASEAYDIDRDKTIRIIPENYILPKGAISAWWIKGDGHLENIVDNDIYMLSGLHLDRTSDEVEVIMSRLNEIICYNYGEEDVNADKQ